MAELHYSIQAEEEDLSSTEVAIITMALSAIVLLCARISLLLCARKIVRGNTLEGDTSQSSLEDAEYLENVSKIPILMPMLVVLTALAICFIFVNTSLTKGPQGSYLETQIIVSIFCAHLMTETVMLIYDAFNCTWRFSWPVVLNAIYSVMCLCIIFLNFGDLLGLVGILTYFSYIFYIILHKAISMDTIGLACLKPHLILSLLWFVTTAAVSIAFPNFILYKLLQSTPFLDDYETQKKAFWWMFWILMQLTALGALLLSISSISIAVQKMFEMRKLRRRIINDRSPLIDC